MRKKYNNLTTFLILIITTFLISCAGSVKSDWACKTPEGGKGNCISISEADLPNSSKSSNFDKFVSGFDSQISYLSPKIQINLIAPKLKDLKKIQLEQAKKQFWQNNSDFENSNSPNHALRTTEKIGKIWFAPYVDSQGYRHSESVVYVVDEESKWKSPNMSFFAQASKEESNDKSLEKSVSEIDLSSDFSSISNKKLSDD